MKTLRGKLNCFCSDTTTDCFDFNFKKQTPLFSFEKKSSESAVRLSYSENKLPGVIGFENDGNICFINAVLQCLIQTHSLAKYLVTNLYKEDLIKNRLFSKNFDNNGEVTEHLALLIKSIWQCEYNPKMYRKFKLTVGRHGPEYIDGSEHDAHEFLIWLLDKVHNDLNIEPKLNYELSDNWFGIRKKTPATPLLYHVHSNSSFIYATFQGQFKSSVICSKCCLQNNSFDPFLSVSVPIPVQGKRIIYVYVLYLFQQPNQLKFGVSINKNSTVRHLKKQLSYKTGVQKSRILLLKIDAFGSQTTFSGHLPISSIKKNDHVYCIEMPFLNFTKQQKEYIVICWVNVVKYNDHCSRFGRPYIMQLHYLTSFKDLHKFMLTEMKMILHDNVLSKKQDNVLFRIKIANSASGESSNVYLDPSADHPLCTDEVYEVLALVDEDSGLHHLKLILEWDIASKQSVIADDSDVIEEHPSVKKILDESWLEEFVTLEDCFKLILSPEVLRKNDKWHCLFCNKKQEAIKKLEFWSAPDILVIHLKRFHQSKKNHSAVKLMVSVDFPIKGLIIKSHLDGSAATTSTCRPCSRKSRKLTPDRNIYDLYGVCNHHGHNLQRGHYTAFCRNLYNGEWYWFDDSNIVPIHESNVVTNAAYILFYRRRGLDNFYPPSSYTQC